MPPAEPPRKRSTAGIAIAITCAVLVAGLGGTALLLSRCTSVGEVIDLPGFRKGSPAKPLVTALCFSVDMDVAADPFFNFLACGTKDGSVHIFDMQFFEPVEAFPAITQGPPVKALAIGSTWEQSGAFSEPVYTGEYFAYTTPTAAGVAIWDPDRPTGNRLRSNSVVSASAGPGLRLDPLYDDYLDHLWVYHTADQTLREWDCASGIEVYTESWYEGMLPISGLSHSTNERYNLVEFAGSHLSVFDTWEATGGLLDFGLNVYSTFEQDTPPPAVSAVGSTGFLALADPAGGGGWRIEVYDFVDSITVAELTAQDEVGALAFSFHGDKLAVGCPGYVLVYDTYTWEETSRLPVK